MNEKGLHDRPGSDSNAVHLDIPAGKIVSAQESKNTLKEELSLVY